MATLVPPNVIDSARRLTGGANRRFLGFGLLMAAVAVLWVTSKWAAGPTYVTLYHDVELATMGNMTESLTKAGIQYRLDAGGTEILVPVQDAARARVILAKDGLPASSHPGMELFDKPTWGMTDFTQRITYRRALEGELSRTISSLDGVDRAEVHLALPDDSPLRRLSRPAEAAVLISLKPGAMLNGDVVQGIEYLVSNSVEGLSAQNVAVVDASGRVLSAPGDSGNVGLSNRQIDQQHSTEKQLADRVDGLLATVLGAGHSRVQVAAKMDFRQTESTVESYDPDGQVLNTEQRSEATGDQTEAGAGNQSVISNTYANSKKVEHTVGSTGTVDKLTVAVLIDQAALAKVAGSPEKADSTLQGFNSMIRNAIGLDSTRGDRLTITPMPFEIDTTTLAKMPKTVAPPRDVMVVAERFSRPAVMLIGIALAFILGLKLLQTPETVPGVGGTGSLANNAELPPGAAPVLLPGEAGAPVGAPMTPAMQASQRLRAGVRSESASHPGVAAQVVRAWIGEPG